MYANIPIRMRNWIKIIIIVIIDRYRWVSWYENKVAYVNDNVKYVFGLIDVRMVTECIPT